MEDSHIISIIATVIAGILLLVIKNMAGKADEADGMAKKSLAKAIDLERRMESAEGKIDKLEEMRVTMAKMEANTDNLQTTVQDVSKTVKAIENHIMKAKH